MGKIRWRELGVPLAIATITTIVVTGVITRILTIPVVSCYDEDTPEQLEYGVEKCLPTGDMSLDSQGL